MAPFFDIGIIGGGLAGCALADRLAAEGLRIALVESGVCAGRGASAFSGGIIRAFDTDPVHSELAINGVLDWIASPFADRVVRQCGVLQLLSDDEAAKCADIVTDLTGTAYPVALLSSREAQVRAPGIALPGPGSHVVFEPAGGTVDVKLASRLLLTAARDRGALVLEHAPILAVRRDDRNVRLEGRDFSLACRIAVVAAGPWSAAWLDDTDLVVRRIQLSIAQAHGIEMCLIDRRRGGYVVPGAAGTVAVGSFDPPAVADPGIIPEPCEDRHARHHDLLSRLTGKRAVPLGDVVGLDAYTPRSQPLMGFTGADDRIYAFTGFSGRGAKYIPYLARQAAAEILSAAG